jgi:hypothetical protein
MELPRETSGLEVAEQSDQDDDGNWNSEEQQQDRSHEILLFYDVATCARSRSLPPNVEAMLAENAPSNSATKSQ